MRSWRGSGSPRGVMVMIIQRETEEFRASKTHSALVDQSYQFAVIQDIKGVPYPVAQELNRRALVVLSSAWLAGECRKFPGWSEHIKARLKQSKAAVESAVAIGQLFGLEGVPSEASDKVAKQRLRSTT